MFKKAARVNKLSSKEKIMKAAKILFGENGFNGTSVRIIADRAGVNVASINYYFTSKEALFYEVIADEAVLIGQTISSIYQESDDFVSMSTKLFKKLYEEPERTTNCMKLLLSMEKLPDDGSALTDDQRQIIKRGHELLESKLCQEFGEKLPKDSMDWATDTMMSIILQIVLMGNSVFIQNLLPEKVYKIDILVKRVERLAQVIRNDLKMELK